ncbi:uncharacterized protein LOC132562150 [Ylistrum balloti]|uniref:uncharacterized protein LOC132562150 n=1 Tax=Ylistrum balloti TaxID=509963 RepID=UPI002905998D|nr:uncharacterized protein LOC132562150 [Ylistrum balloti]
MDSKYYIVFMSLLITVVTDFVFSQVVNSTGCVSSNWRKQWKSCYMKHCGSNPGTCISSRGIPECKRVKDGCGMCVKRWFVDNQEVQCERPTTRAECPPNVILRNCQTRLCENICLDDRFSGTRCRVNRCGVCSPEYFVDGQWLMCPSQPFSPIAGNDLQGLSFFHPEVAGAVMTGNELTPSIAAANRGVGIPVIARAEESTNSFRSAGPGDVAEPTVCRRGVTERICENLCANAQCENYPEAVCRVNNCGGCNTEFYVGTERVNCRGEKCPPGVTYFHTCDSCAYNYCHNEPKAECRMEACGKCTSTFWYNNKLVPCNALNILDSCPGNAKRHVCEYPVCRFDTCPRNSSVSCIVDNCGGCRPRFIHKLTKETAACPGYWMDYNNGKSHEATPTEKAKALKERRRHLNESQVVPGNTGTTTEEIVNPLPDSASTPPRQPQNRPGFVDQMTGLSPLQRDPMGNFISSNIDSLALGPLPQPSVTNSGQSPDLLNALQIARAERPSGLPSGPSPRPTRRRPSSPQPQNGSPSSDQSQRRQPSSPFRGMNRRRPSDQSRQSSPVESGRSSDNDRSSSPFRGINRRRTSSSGSPRPSRRRESTRSGSSSSIFRGMNRRRTSSESQGRQFDAALPIPNSQAAEAQRILPLVNNAPTNSFIIRTEQVPVVNSGSTGSVPVLQRNEADPSSSIQDPSVPIQQSQDSRQGNAQAIAEIDKIILNLDKALRKAHPPMNRVSSTGSRQTQTINSPLSSEAVRPKPSITSSKQSPSKPLVANKPGQTPLSLHTTDKPSLHKTKSAGKSKPKKAEPRTNAHKSVQNEKKPSKPERKTVPLQSLMFPTEFFTLFQTFGGGSSFAIPSRTSGTTTKKP